VHDIVIRGGEVVDGTGSPPRRADVAIDGDRVTDVGVLEEPGRRELDATGRVVTPGFVDIHTHLDAQLFWDPVGSPSCWHGVTSVVLGNCGVTFAPVRPGEERYLAELMEAVEDIPADTIMEGLDWGWETYGGYLDALGRKQLGVNVGGMVGHCALRYYVMGSEVSTNAPPPTTTSPRWPAWWGRPSRRARSDSPPRAPSCTPSPTDGRCRAPTPVPRS